MTITSIFDNSSPSRRGIETPRLGTCELERGCRRQTLLPQGHPYGSERTRFEHLAVHGKSTRRVLKAVLVTADQNIWLLVLSNAPRV